MDAIAQSETSVPSILGAFLIRGVARDVLPRVYLEAQSASVGLRSESSDLTLFARNPPYATGEESLPESRFSPQFASGIQPGNSEGRHSGRSLSASHARGSRDSVDPAGGRFASQTYGGGLRFQINARQDVTGYASYQKRTQDRRTLVFGLSYGIHF